MRNWLLLQSKNDIPFEKAQLLIHNPTIKEIALIGQQTFFIGCEYLNFSKDHLNEQDKISLKDFSNFEILLTIIKNDNATIKQIKVCMELVLLLLFPDYKINFLPSSIMFSRKTEDQTEYKIIDKENFEDFRNIVSEMFCLSEVTNKSKKKYNPGGVQAMALVKKFEQRERKLAKLKNKNKDNEIKILEQYISILAVGQQKDKNQLMQYTVYQLFDQLKRFRKKEDFDIYIKAKMAGAQNLQDVDNWMNDIHSENTT